MRSVYGEASRHLHFPERNQCGHLYTAFRLAVETIKGVAKKAGFLKTSDQLDDDEKEEYRTLLDKDMDEATVFLSIKTLSELLEKHYETKVVVLIDEYDVPLAKAFENGYYDQMVF